MTLQDILIQPFTSAKRSIKSLSELDKEDFTKELIKIIDTQYERSSRLGAKGASISQSEYMATMGRIKKYEIILNMLMGYGDIR